MKKLQYILLALAFVLAGCNNKDSIWNVMDDMDSRIATLEVLCQEMNTNISALETLIKAQNNGDYITNITEIRNGSTIVGYTITFKNHEPVTIYNGTNGKDGHDGTDGYKPTVGAKQDTDGIYYWTVDGDWLTDANGNKIPVTGEKGDKGDKGDPGDKGQDGKDGQDGANGVNGNTPQLKIDGGYWYISYDGGTNWTQLGKATGEDGKDGTNGTNGSDGTKGDKGDKGEKGDKGDAGDTMFQSVTQDTNYVYFTLADGTVIKIAKNGSGNGGTHADEDFIEFKDLNVKSALLRHTPEIDTNHDGEISYAEAKAVKRMILHDPDIVSFKELQYFENLASISLSGSKLFEFEFPAKIDSIIDLSTLLSNIKVPAKCKYIGRYAFSGCTSMSTITFEEGSQCEYIGERALDGCTSLTHIEFPNSVKYIGENVVSGCNNLQSITFPENYVDGGHPIYEKGKQYLNLRTIIWNAIGYPQAYYFNRDGYVKIGLGCDVGGHPGLYAPNIKEVHFGDKVTTIPAYLCYKMDKLQDLVIPESVTSIGDNAFYRCGLTEVIIGKKVESIGRYAFDKCSSLKKIYCKAQQPPIIDVSFPSSVSVIYVPRESVEEYRVMWSDFASKILGYDFE